MEQLHMTMHDETTANPFGIPMEKPLQRTDRVSKINPKVPESTDLGMFGTRHPTDAG